MVVSGVELGEVFTVRQLLVVMFDSEKRYATNYTSMRCGFERFQGSQPILGGPKNLQECSKVLGMPSSGLIKS